MLSHLNHTLRRLPISRCRNIQFNNHTFSTSISQEFLTNLRMIPEFVQAEQHLQNKDSTTATLSLERVQDICDSSMGTTSPMSLSVHTMMLNYLTSSFSTTTFDPKLKSLAYQTITRSTTEPNDILTCAYLALVLGKPDIVLNMTPSETTIDSYHANLHLHRGIAFAATNSTTEAIASLNQAHDTFSQLDTTNETSELGQIHALNNLGCVYFAQATPPPSTTTTEEATKQATEQAIATWKKALHLITTTSSSNPSTFSNAYKICEAEILSNLGNVHTETGDPNEGIVCLSRAVALLTEIHQEYIIQHQIEDNGTGHPNIVRPLTLLGRAHHADSRAVSAEGYFRSALSLLDTKLATGVIAPTIQLQHLETLRMYASLMVDWESRSGDYKIQIQLANDMHQSIVNNGAVAVPMSMSLPIPNNV